MKFFQTATVAAALLGLGSVALAADTPEHKSHHPAAAASAPSAGEAPQAAAATADKKAMGMGGGMMAGSQGKHDMQGMHADMMAKHQAMEKRMEMMESMMKMMAERMPAPATK